MQPGSCEIPERKTIFIPDAETETAGQDLTLLHAEERGRGRTSAAPLPWHNTATSVKQSGGTEDPTSKTLTLEQISYRL